MQQQSHIFVFSTKMANEAAEAVWHGQYSNICFWHMNLAETKQYLEKHPIKITQQFRPGQTSLLHQYAQNSGQKGCVKGAPQMGPQMSPYGPPAGGPGGFPPPGPPPHPMMRGPSPQMPPHARAPMGQGYSNFGPGSNEMSPHMAGPGGPWHGGPGDNGNNWQSPQPQPSGSPYPPGPPHGQGMCGPNGPRFPPNNGAMPSGMYGNGPPGPPGNSGPYPGNPCNSPHLMQQQMSMPPNQQQKPGQQQQQQQQQQQMMNQGMNMMGGENENLTPQQRQHREEQLAKLQQLKQTLLPDLPSDPSKPPGMPPQGQPMFSSMRPQQPPPGSHMHPQDPSLCPPMHPGHGQHLPPHPHSLPPGHPGDHMMNQSPMSGPMSNATSPASAGDWIKPYMDEPPPSAPPTTARGSGGRGRKGRATPSSVSASSPGLIPASPGSMTRMPGPPPPYHSSNQGPGRGAPASGGLMPPHPGSPATNISSCPLPSPKGAGRHPYSSPGTPGQDQMTLNSPKPLNGPRSGRASNPSIGDSMSDGAPTPTPLASGPATGSGGGRKRKARDNSSNASNLSSLDDSLMMNDISMNVKREAKSPLVSLGMKGSNEPQLMPVPSPQQIQYSLNQFEGQELTIQKQRNTSLDDQDIISSADLDLAFSDTFGQSVSSMENGSMRYSSPLSNCGPMAPSNMDPMSSQMNRFTPSGPCDLNQLPPSNGSHFNPNQEQGPGLPRFMSPFDGAPPMSAPRMSGPMGMNGVPGGPGDVSQGPNAMNQNMGMNQFSNRGGPGGNCMDGPPGSGPPGQGGQGMRFPSPDHAFGPNGPHKMAMRSPDDFNSGIRFSGQHAGPMGQMPYGPSGPMMNDPHGHPHSHPHGPPHPHGHPPPPPHPHGPHGPHGPPHPPPSHPHQSPNFNAPLGAMPPRSHCMSSGGGGGPSDAVSSSEHLQKLQSLALPFDMPSVNSIKMEPGGGPSQAQGPPHGMSVSQAGNGTNVTFHSQMSSAMQHSNQTPMNLPPGSTAGGHQPFSPAGPSVSMVGGPQTVNNTYVNANLSIQQLNITQPGGPGQGGGGGGGPGGPNGPYGNPPPPNMQGPGGPGGPPPPHSMHSNMGMNRSMSPKMANGPRMTHSPMSMGPGGPGAPCATRPPRNTSAGANSKPNTIQYHPRNPPPGVPNQLQKGPPNLDFLSQISSGSPAHNLQYLPKEGPNSGCPPIRSQMMPMRPGPGMPPSGMPGQPGHPPHMANPQGDFGPAGRRNGPGPPNAIILPPHQGGPPQSMPPQMNYGGPLGPPPGQQRGPGSMSPSMDPGQPLPPSFNSYGNNKQANFMNPSVNMNDPVYE